MPSLRRKLPPPNALIVFEAAARNLHFTRAASELNVTQAAVSRQIRKLESDLGVQLFRRGHRSLDLTAEGRRFQQAVTLGLEYIAYSADTLRRSGMNAPVTIAANNAVAFYWLRQHIAAYQHENPGLDIRLVASDRHLDFLNDGIDVAIRYGGGEWPGVLAHLLFAEEVFPVCSPSYLEERAPPASMDDLQHETLLQMEPHGPDWVTWAGLLRDMGASPNEDLTTRGPRFNTFPLLLQAALDGEGFAIGTRHLVDQPLARGQLVRPVSGSVLTGRGYYLALPAESPVNPVARDFGRWLLNRVAAPGGQR